MPTACVKLFLAVFVVPLLSSTSLSSSLLALSGMLAHNSDNSWCLPSAMSSGMPALWQAAAALLGWDETMGVRSHGQGRPQKCCKVLFMLQMLSEVSVDGVFQHHLEKMSSASGGFAPRSPAGSCPWTPLRQDFRPSDPLIAHPWKKSCWRPLVRQF